MAASRQQDIIAALVTRLATIDGTGGYDTDFGGRVKDSQPNWDQNSGKIPAISVFQLDTDSDERSERQFARSVTHTCKIGIRIFLLRGTDAENARKAIADVLKAIKGQGTDSNDYKYERFWDATNKGLTMRTIQKGHQIEYAKDSFEIVAANVDIEVEYITPKWET